MKDSLQTLQTIPAVLQRRQGQVESFSRGGALGLGLCSHWRAGQLRTSLKLLPSHFHSVIITSSQQHRCPVLRPLHPSRYCISILSNPHFSRSLIDQICMPLALPFLLQLHCHLPAISYSAHPWQHTPLTRSYTCSHSDSLRVLAICVHRTAMSESCNHHPLPEQSCPHSDCRLQLDRRTPTSSSATL